MATVKGDVLIDAPVDVVFDAVADERNEPAYNPALLRVELLTGEPVGVGSRFHAVHASGRGPMHMIVEITGFERPRRITSVTYASWAEIRGSVTFEPVGAATRMRWAWDVRPKGIAKVLTPFIGVIGGREERACWGGLRQWLARGGRPAVTPTVPGATAGRSGGHR